MNKEGLIYILGAGRSGSTILSIVLNDHEKVRTVGELHQFFQYLANNEPCSCGENMDHCIYWQEVQASLPKEMRASPEYYEQLAHSMEYHSAIPYYLTGRWPKKVTDEYQNAQKDVMKALHQDFDGYVLDSAKYIGRFFAMNKIFKGDVKGIFLVRDVRGVIWSFKKKVQSSNPPWRTLLYYLLINTLGQLLAWFYPNVLKVRYEDIVENPEKTFSIIGEFINLDYTRTVTKIKKQESFETPHIVGGNRLKKKKDIVLRKDDEWIKNMPLSQKMGYYLVCFPLMILNKYKIINKSS